MGVGGNIANKQKETGGGGVVSSWADEVVASQSDIAAGKGMQAIMCVCFKIWRMLYKTSVFYQPQSPCIHPSLFVVDSSLPFCLLLAAFPRLLCSPQYEDSSSTRRA